MTRRVTLSVGVAVAVFLSVLAVAGAPASAANTSIQASDQLVVGSQHDSFGTSGEEASPSLANMTVEGSGSDASVVYDYEEYNPITDEGDGDADGAGLAFGDYSDDTPIQTEHKLTPSTSFTASELTIRTGGVVGSDYGATVDVYISEGDVDQSTGGGTLVAENWDPDWVDGYQTIPISQYEFTAGNTYHLEFVTESTDSDGNRDSLSIYHDNSPSTTWRWDNIVGESSHYGDIEVQTPESAEYLSAQHDVTGAEQAAVNLTLQDTQATITIQAYDGSSWNEVNQTTVSSSGNYTLDVSSASHSTLRTIIDFDAQSTSSRAEVHDESILFTNHQPEASNLSPSDGADLSSETTEFSVDVSDAEFSTAQGDSVEARLFVDGEQVGSKTVTSNQTVSLDHSISEGGAHTYYWELEDSYGSTTPTTERTINVPSTLSVRSETNPSEFVDNSTVNITYYYGEDIQRMSTSDGEVDLTGLPVDEPIIAVADADGYHSRAAVITSVYEQNTLYLLNSSLETHELIFDISDPTGAYPRSDTVLLVQRDIQLNGSTEWRTVAGDLFGAQGVTTDLQAEERYRLVIRNLETGERAGLGSFTPTSSQLITLEPESASVDVGLEDNTSIGYAASRSSSGEQIIVEYADHDQTTTSLKFMIHERYNESNVLVENQTFTDLGNISYTEPLSASEQNTSWVVDFYWSTSSGDAGQASVVVGQGPRTGLIPGNLDNVYRASIGVAVLLITALLFSQLNVGVGAITTSLVGGLLWYLGFLSGVTTGPAIVLSIGLSGLLYYNNGGAVT